MGGLTAGVVVATRKVKAAQSAAEAEKGRAVLAGMSDLADLADLKLEREEKQALKGEQAIMRKKFEGFQSEMGKLRSTLEAREQDIKQLQVLSPCIFAS